MVAAVCIVCDVRVDSYHLGEVNGIDVSFQDRAVPISWFVVIWFLPTPISLEPSEPDIVGKIGRVDDTWFRRK